VDGNVRGNYWVGTGHQLLGLHCGTKINQNTTVKRSTGRGMMFDDRPKWLETIDHMVTEKRKELDIIYLRFQGGYGRCRCPLCKSLEKGNTNGESKNVRTHENDTCL
jgi:hypothetical protein